MIELPHFLTIGAIIFCLGLIGFLTRRNLIVMFLSAEMMLQGVTLNLVAFSRFHGNMHGQVFALMITAVAACEAGIALALIVTLYRRQRSLDVSRWQLLREEGIDAHVDTEPLPEEPRPEAMPHLVPAGAEPARREDREYV